MALPHAHDETGIETPAACRPRFGENNRPLSARIPTRSWTDRTVPEP